MQITDSLWHSRELNISPLYRVQRAGVQGLHGDELMTDVAAKTFGNLNISYTCVFAFPGQDVLESRCRFFDVSYFGGDIEVALKYAKIRVRQIHPCMSG